MNKKKKEIWKEYYVAVLFFTLGLAGFFISGFSIRMVLGDLIERIGRNLFLILSLIIPVMAGMGLNFSMVIGAMVGQIALIFVIALNLEGFWGLIIAALFSLPIGILCGKGSGFILNKTRGKEMITGLLLGFFASGLYQFFCMVLPVSNAQIALEGGIGIKSTIDLKAIQYGFDRFPITFSFFGFKIPLFSFFLSVLLCCFLCYLKKTKFGQNMRIVSRQLEGAKALGIPVERTRTKAIVFSTVFAAWGQIISLQNIGTMSTFGSHEQVGIYAAAALLAGGATTKRAEVKHAVFGVFLFYFLFIVAPKAGNQLFGDAQTGEFFRVFLAYGTIAFAMVLNEKRKKKG